MFVAAEVVQFLEAGTKTGRDGKPAPDWDNANPVLTDVAAVEPLASTEPLQDGRQSVITGYRLYFDHDVEVDRLWRCVVRNQTLQVQGRAARWQSPFTGWKPGTVCEVRWTDG